MRLLNIVIVLTVSINALAQQAVGTGFNYQGELLDNGTPANDSYDMEFTLFDSETGSTPLLIPKITLSGIIVNNGLFNIPNIDFNFIPYYQGNEVWMEVAVKKSSDPNEFEVLTSRQRISAVPYSYKSEASDYSTIAGDLLANGANSDDVLTYDGTGWSAKPPGWSDQNNILSTANASYQVIIGNSSGGSQAKLSIQADEDGIVTRFNGSGEMYNEYLESDASIGYVGSIQNGSNPGTTDDDFEIGTTNPNSSGNMHLTTQEVPRLTVASNGNIGINNTTPNGKLDINIDTNDNAKAVRVVKGGEIFGVHSNAGVSIGDATVPPPSGMYSRGDVKQSINSNGIVKFMVSLNCAGPLTSINKQYNGVNNDLITAQTGISNSDGFCQIHFPSDININDRYYVYSTISGSTFVPSCATNSNPTNILRCAIQQVSTSTYRNNEINLLVY